MSAQLAKPVLCRAGCARSNVTPPVGTPMAGYFHDRIGETVRDDLFAHAVVIDHGGVQVAIVSCDLVSIDGDLARPTKALIQEQTGIPPERVLISATHTHTGPEIRESGITKCDGEYVGRLPAMIARAVGEAAENMFLATLHPGRTSVEGLAHNRLFRMKDGQEVFGAGNRPDLVVGVAGPTDPEMVTLGIVDEQGRLRCLVTCYALHVDVIGGGTANFLSADWPGELSRAIQCVYGEDVVSVFLQGTSGDINHRVHSPTHLPTGGVPKAIQIGRAIAGTAIYATERAEPMTELCLDAALEKIAIPYYTRDQALLDEIAELKQRESLGDFEQFLVDRTESWPHDGQSVDVTIQTIRIGDLALAALPAEIFVRIGLEIKHFSPARDTMVVSLANDLVTYYVPTTDQAERGAYGAKPILSRWLCSDAGRRMADHAQVMLHKLWPG